MKNSERSFILKVQKDHRVFFKQHKTDGVEKRIQYLKKLKKLLDKKEASIMDALFLDLKKPAFESYTSEVLMVQKELSLLIKNIKEWAAPKRVSGSLLSFPSQDFIISEPYGTVLLISPWNYPFQLAMIPFIGAIAAGNTAVLKPSESAPHTAQIIEEILMEVFPENWVKVIQGDVTVGEALLKYQWDYIFYTGSTHVGRIVAKAAAEFLTPTTLELGGKSPCVVDGTTPIQKTARRIIWGKFLNCGQTCIAPDFLIVKRNIKDKLITHLSEEIEKAYGENPKNSEDYPRIVNKTNLSRLSNLIKDTKIIFGGEYDLETCYFSPTIIDEPDIKSALMAEEIFGPILPIISYDDENQIEELMSKYEKPLALYVFSSNKNFSEKIICKYSFGGGAINDTIIQVGNPNLPFGGVGHSGIGKYHGKTSFDQLSHKKAIVKKGNWLDIKIRYAPYKGKLKYVKKFFKLFS